MMDVSKAGYGKIVAQGVPVARLVGLLTGATGQLVSDKTGLTGLYDFTLEYSDDPLVTPDALEPSLKDALREQLGLKLESSKGPVQVLVVDHVERPSED